PLHIQFVFPKNKRLVIVFISYKGRISEAYQIEILKSPLFQFLGIYILQFHTNMPLHKTFGYEIEKRAEGFVCKEIGKLTMDVRDICHWVMVRDFKNSDNL